MSEIEELKLRIAELEYELSQLKDTYYAFQWPIRVTQTQQIILSFFMNRPNKVVTKESIWVHLYGARPDADQAQVKTVDVLMCKLRQRIRAYGIEIVTCWGRGFIIDNANHLKLVALSKMEFGVTPEEARKAWAIAV